MTVTEFRDWVNTYIKANSKKAITGAIMNEFGMKFLETYAHIDNPLLPYSTTIEDGDLVDSKITITHNLGTWVPDFIMYDENNCIIYNEYFNAKALSLNTLEFEFFDVIPATGNGYYKLVIWKVLENVSPRFNEVFTSDFSSWTGGEPDNFTVILNGSATIENDGDRAKMTGTGLLNRVVLIPDLTVEVNREYQVTVTIDQGGLYVISGNNQVLISTTGTHTINLFAGSVNIRLRQHGNTCIIDDLIIKEAV